MAITEKYILICDDVRREDNGKIIILGMYFNEVTVPQLPFPMPSLTFFCVLESERPGTFRFSFKLKHEEGGTQPLAAGMGEAPVGDPQQPIIMPIKMVGVQLNAVGLYTFSLEFDGQAPIVQTFNVRLVVPGQVPFGQPRNLR
jgi:hypothetical protein